MAGNLFDQLKKAGLVNEQKAKQLKKEKYQQTKQNKGKQVENEAAVLAAKAAQEKAEKDRLLNLERQAAQAQKALQAEIKQIIESNKITDYDGDLVFNFVDQGKVKSLNVNAKIRQRLVDGVIRIACVAGAYVLISDEAAAKVEQRDAGLLIPLKEAEKIADEDAEYYAKFAIPDDLVW